MEKLIELLNECTNGRFKTEQDLRLCIEMRGYCRDFIKWLVDNDKIDFIKLIQKQGNWGIDNIMLNPIKELEYYKLLMLLSIQNEPLTFLISILK